MAFRRRNMRKKRAFRRGRSFRRRRFFGRKRRSAIRRGNIFFVKFRKHENISISDANPTLMLTRAWALDDFSTGGEIAHAAGLYEQFKIARVKVEWFPYQASGNYGNVMFNQNVDQFYRANWKDQVVFSAIDHVDDAAPSAVADLLQYNSMQKHMASRYWKRYFKPRATAYYQNDAGTPISTPGGPIAPWCSTLAAGQSIKWRGLKIASDSFKNYDAGTLPDLEIAKVVTTLYVAFKRRR